MNKEETTEHKQQASGWLAVLLERGKVPFVFASFACAVALLVIIWRGGEQELAKFLGYLLGGGLLILQIFVSNRRATASEETAKAMQKTAELTEKGNIAERFKNAIEHLGNDSASIRLGGIYALHHIAQETEEYRERVFEILCAHIRETTTREGYEPRVITIERSDLAAQSATMIEPIIEIQSVLYLLFVRIETRKIYEGMSAHLKDTDLRGAMLLNADLQNAMLWKSDLRGTYLNNANLQGSILSYANLQRIKLDGADLQNANLEGADLRDVTHIQIEQLLKVKTLYFSQLPDGMKEIINKQKPELFECMD